MRDRYLETLKRFSDKKIVAEVKAKNDIPLKPLADNIVCELEKKYNIKKKEREN